MLAAPLLALQFLTVFPVRVPGSDGAPRMERALPWFPSVGALLGLLLALGDLAVHPVFTLEVRDALILAGGALLTGMLHLDGFADCCDGLLGVRPPERRLEIMRDSRVGAYGAIGIVLLLLLRFAALGVLPPAWRFAALVAAPALGRWGMVLAVVGYPYARAAGAGAAFHARPRHALGATLALAVVLAFLVLLTNHAPWPILMLLGSAAIVAALWGAWASRRLGGGLTGDTYGALNELVELAVLLIVPLCARLVL